MLRRGVEVVCNGMGQPPQRLTARGRSLCKLLTQLILACLIRANPERRWWADGYPTACSAPGSGSYTSTPSWSPISITRFARWVRFTGIRPMLTSRQGTGRRAVAVLSVARDAAQPHRIPSTDGGMLGAGVGVRRMTCIVAGSRHHPWPSSMTKGSPRGITAGVSSCDWQTRRLAARRPPADPG